MQLTYEEFYEKYYKLIKSIVCKYKLKTPKEDVVQDIMIIIWQDFERIKNTDIKNEKAYVCGITRNCCNTFLRIEHEKGMWIDNSTELIEIYSETSMIYNTETTVTRDGRTIVLDDYIKRYRERQRQYFHEHKEQYKEWCENNKEKVNGYKKKYYQGHKEQHKQYAREHRQLNKEKYDLYYEKYREKNKDKINDYQKEWNEKNKEKMKDYHKEYNKKYYQEHKEKIKLYQVEYRKKKKNS